jgi:hypothetical protein
MDGQILEQLAGLSRMLVARTDPDAPKHRGLRIAPGNGAGRRRPAVASDR